MYLRILSYSKILSSWIKQVIDDLIFEAASHANIQSQISNKCKYKMQHSYSIQACKFVTIIDEEKWAIILTTS